MDVSIMKKYIIIPLVLVFFSIFACGGYFEGQCYTSTVTKLSVEVIKKLAELGKTKGSKAVGLELVKHAEGLSPEAKAVFFDSSYVKILVEQKRITPSMSEEILKNLSGVPGFRSALSKMCGMSEAKTAGHGFEVLTANALQKKGYQVVAIGERFNDGIKTAATDIDLIVEKGANKYIFELKNYHPSSIDNNALINFRGDMQSLNAYAKENRNVKSIFAISSRPNDQNVEKLLEATAKSQNVKILYGDSDTIAMLVEMLK